MNEHIFRWDSMERKRIKGIFFENEAKYLLSLHYEALKIGNETFCPYCNLPMISTRNGRPENEEQHFFETLQAGYECQFCGYYVLAEMHDLSSGLITESTLRSYDAEIDNQLCCELSSSLHNYIHRIRSLDPYLVEQCIASIFKNQGYNIIMTSKSRDGGIDFYILDKNGIVKAVQVKRYKRNVGVEHIRQLLGVQLRDDIRQSILITTADSFTRGAIRETKTKNIKKRGYAIELLNIFDVLKELRLFNTNAYTYSEIEKLVKYRKY